MDRVLTGRNIVSLPSALYYANRSFSSVPHLMLMNCTRPLFRHDEMKLIHMCVMGAGTARIPGPMFLLPTSGYILLPATETLPLCTFSLKDATRFIKITGPCTYINLPSTQAPLRIVRHSQTRSASNTHQKVSLYYSIQR